MRRTDLLRWAAFVVPVVIGLVASAVLAVDYMRPAPVFCDADGGCGMVKRTIFASFLGVETPLWGIGGFLVLGVLSVLRGRTARVALAAAASIGALVAGLLIYVQLAMHTICPYCAATDASAIAVCAAALVRLAKGWDPPAHARPRAVVSGSFAVALAAPLVAGFAVTLHAPAPIEAEIAKTPKGMVTIVDFVDFECPFCRETDAALEPVLAAHKDKIRLVRKQVPLSRIHPHALEAARAACCGEALGKGDEMAEALFTAPVEDLTVDGCASIAERIGIAPDAFRACVGQRELETRIKEDSDAFKAAGGRGLPTIFVGVQRIEGAQDRATLEKAVERAIGG